MGILLYRGREGGEVCGMEEGAVCGWSTMNVTCYMGLAALQLPRPPCTLPARPALARSLAPRALALRSVAPRSPSLARPLLARPSNRRS